VVTSEVKAVARTFRGVDGAVARAGAAATTVANVREKTSIPREANRSLRHLMTVCPMDGFISSPPSVVCVRRALNVKAA
jgi:hypothetical protein